jgi:hypothetical protein
LSNGRVALDTSGPSPIQPAITPRSSPATPSSHHHLVAWLVIRTIIRPVVRTQIRAPIIISRSTADLAPTTATAVTIVLSSESREPLLLSVRVDVCADDEADDVEEGDPGGFWEELLGEGERDGRHDPADFHDGPETGFDGGAHLVEGAGAGDEGHGDEVDAVLDGGDLDLFVRCVLGVEVGEFGAHQKIANENLKNLRLQALAPLEDLLQQADEDVAQGCANKGTVQRHLGDARGEVVAALAPVVRDPRREKLLQTGQGAGCEDLGAQRVALQLLQVRLSHGPLVTTPFLACIILVALTAR